MPHRSPTILAIDTAADICSVALLLDGGICEQSESVGHRHSERVLPMTQALLANADIALPDCDALAFGAGPGAFTGLRIACGIVQGLAYGADRSVIAVGNLEAQAYEALRRHPDAGRVLCAIDARMRETYCAVYDRGEEVPVERVAPHLATAMDLAALIGNWKPNLVAGDLPVTLREELLADTAPVELVTARAGAAAIVGCALPRFRSGITSAPALAAPLYVRDRVALTIDERRAARVTVT